MSRTPKPLKMFIIFFFLRCLPLPFGGWVTVEVLAQQTVAGDQGFRGDIPMVNTIYPAQVFQEDAETYWLKNDRRVWSLDLSTRVWKQWPDLRLDSIKTFAGYSKKSQSFYLWSLGTGLVYQWEPGTGVTSLLSKPIDHKNQFGHVHFFRTAAQGELYVFGGYGNWQYTNRIKYFSPNRADWLLYTYPAPKTELQLPTPRSDAFGLYDPKEDQFHLFSGASTTYHRDDLSNDSFSFGLKEYWILDLASGEWTQIPIYGEFINYPSTDFRPRVDFLHKNFGAMDTVQDHYWYPIYVEQASNTVGLMLYNDALGYALVTPLQVRYTKGNATLLTLIYDYKKNDLLTLWVPLSPVGQDAEIQHQYAQLPDAATLRSLVLQQVKQYKDTARNQVLFRILSALLLVCLPILLYQGIKNWDREAFLSYWKRWTHRTPNKYPYRADLQISYLSEQAISLNKLEIKAQFSSLTLRLLPWLLWKRLEGDEYILAEDIESRFVGDLSNFDHLRKRRNSLIQRLNNELAQLFLPYPMCSMCIKDRLFLDDKRKREYYLDIQQVQLVTDLDSLFNRSSQPSVLTAAWSLKQVDPQRVLFSYREEPWAQEIQQAIQAKQLHARLPAE